VVLFFSDHLSWHKILSYSRMRKQYVPKYIEALQRNATSISVNDNKDIKECDCQLDYESIIQCRYTLTCTLANCIVFLSKFICTSMFICGLSWFLLDILSYQQTLQPCIHKAKIFISFLVSQNVGSYICGSWEEKEWTRTRSSSKLVVVWMVRYALPTSTAIYCLTSHFLVFVLHSWILVLQNLSWQ